MPSYDSSLGNIMTRLGGLKNVSGRRVMPGAEFQHQIEGPPIDVEGTASYLPNFSNFQAPQNLPEPDLGGELSPQSYDVRANTVANTDQDPNVLQRFGRALADYFSPEKRAQQEQENRQLIHRAQGKSIDQTPPIATAQVDRQEGLPPVTASEQEGSQFRAQAPESSPGFLGAISDYFNPTKRSQMADYNTDLVQDSQLMAQGRDPNQVRAEKHAQLNQQVEAAMQNPWQYSAYGAADEVANNPALQAQFKQITGVDFEPQIAAQVSSYEEAMKGVEDSLNGEVTQLNADAENIRQRILNNQSTNADKLYIGLALLMPLLIGGIFGKEAGLGALAGASQGFADVLGGKQKAIREDEATLLDLSKQKAGNQERLANIGLEKAKLGPALRKLLPEDPNAHLVGMREATFTDPHTGEDIRGVEIKPGLIARPEFISSKEGKMDMLKAANELSETKAYVDDVNDLTEDVIHIVSQLQDPSAVWKGFTQILTKTSPTALAKLSQDVEFDGRKQNAGVLLEEKLGFLANKYGQAQQLGQLDRAAQNHIKKIIENPTNSFISAQDSLNQVLEIRKLAQRGLIQTASNKGFIPEFLVADMGQKNEPLFNKLNNRERQSRAEQIKRKLLANETNYAK